MQAMWNMISAVVILQIPVNMDPCKICILYRRVLNSELYATSVITKTNCILYRRVLNSELYATSVITKINFILYRRVLNSELYATSVITKTNFWQILFKLQFNWGKISVQTQFVLFWFKIKYDSIDGAAVTRVLDYDSIDGAAVTRVLDSGRPESVILSSCLDWKMKDCIL